MREVMVQEPEHTTVLWRWIITILSNEMITMSLNLQHPGRYGFPAPAASAKNRKQTTRNQSFILGLGLFGNLAVTRPLSGLGWVPAPEPQEQYAGFRIEPTPHLTLWNKTGYPRKPESG
jgi:hypothetical protein